MPKPSLTLNEQLALCRQVARLVHSKLPLEGELARLARSESSLGTSAAQRVDQQLSAGQSLSDALAAGTSRRSRSLAACIEVGERSERLDRTLDAWTDMHLASSRYGQTLRTAMVYPCLLIAVTLCSLGYVVWALIPEYRDTYAQYNARLPTWLEWLVAVRQQMGWLMIGLLLTAMAPLLWWYWRRQSFDRAGLPNEAARRARVLALSSQLLQCGVEGSVPLAALIPLCAQASGANASDAQQAFVAIGQQRSVPTLGREASLLTSSLHAGLLTPVETSQHLSEVAGYLKQLADDQAARAARWLPMLVALIVGALTIVTYVCLIYWPWLQLLQRIAQPQ